MPKNSTEQHCSSLNQKSLIHSSNASHLKATILAAFLIFGVLNNAFAFSNSSECKRILRGLIIPPLKSPVMDKSTILAEIADGSDGVYSARLFVLANSPENMNKQVSIGWVDLDIKMMKAYDVTADPDAKVEIEINQKLYKKYIAKCISPVQVGEANSMVCDASAKGAKKSQILIHRDDSPKVVIGHGRLQFYSAPDEKCKVPGLFILPTEKVEARSEFEQYTLVNYINLKTEFSASGWVESRRLKPAGFGASSHQP